MSQDRWERIAWGLMGPCRARPPVDAVRFALACGMKLERSDDGRTRRAGSRVYVDVRATPVDLGAAVLCEVASAALQSLGEPVTREGVEGVASVLAARSISVPSGVSVVDEDPPSGRRLSLIRGGRA